MAQNTSHAVMAQRTEQKESLDDFPTPPWATRALLQHAIPSKFLRPDMTCLEPATGRGYMSTPLMEYFSKVVSSDIHDYGFGEVRDFLGGDISGNLPDSYPAKSFDWVITNPPFKLAQEFVMTSLKIARVGVAMLVRTVFIESVGRHERLFVPYPPFRMAQFVERVPMVKGRVDKKASTATGYCWIIWVHSHKGPTELFWIPSCRKKLEKSNDYQLPGTVSAKSKNARNNISQSNKEAIKTQTKKSSKRSPRRQSTLFGENF